MLGINHLTERGDILRGCCPLCKHEDTRAFIVTPAKGTFYCFRCKGGGDVISLVARSRDVKDREAAQWIADQGKGAARSADNGSATSAEPEATARKSDSFKPLDYLKTLDAEHEALKDLDILPETLIEFKAGYSSKGLNRGRLAIAWCGMDGEIKAFIGVALDGSLPLYLMPKGQPLPYWFGCHRVEADDELRILPTILDVLRAWENGVVNVICPIAPTQGDALSSLKALVETKNLIVEF